METPVAAALEEAAELATTANEESLGLLASAEAFAIATLEEYHASGELLKDIKDKQKALNATRLKITRPIDAAKAEVMDLFKPVGERLGKAEQAIKNAMLGFTREQERKRQEAQAKIRERLLRLAEKQREQGHDDRAEETDTRAATVPELAVETPPVKVAGVHTVTTWSAEVTDLLALARACASGDAPLEFIQADMPQLNAVARLQKEALNIPGVKAVSKEVVASRAQSGQA